MSMSNTVRRTTPTRSAMHGRVQSSLEIWFLCRTQTLSTSCTAVFVNAELCRCSSRRSSGPAEPGPRHPSKRHARKAVRFSAVAVCKQGGGGIRRSEATRTSNRSKKKKLQEPAAGASLESSGMPDRPRRSTKLPERFKDFVTSFRSVFFIIFLVPCRNTNLVQQKLVRYCLTCEVHLYTFWTGRDGLQNTTFSLTRKHSVVSSMQCCFCKVLHYDIHGVSSTNANMAKPFDRVNHSMLALNLRSVGVYGVELKWFDSYLCGRSICTIVGGVRSFMQSISSGVHQGSILRPLLFIILYRDLPAVSTSKTAMFSDDTLIHNCCKGIPAASSSASVCTCSLSRDLQLISDWADGWQTSFNASKTVHMLFRRKHRRHTARPSPVLLLNSIEIPFAESTRHLGVTLTSTRSWSEHIRNIIERQQFKIFILKRLARRRGAEDVVKRLYVGVVPPSLEYASALWDGCLRRDRIALERVQLAIACSVLRCPRQDRHNWEVLRQIGWPTLAWCRRRNKLLFLWDLLIKQGPPDLASDIPKLAFESADYSLRGPSLAFPRCLTPNISKAFYLLLLSYLIPFLLLFLPILLALLFFLTSIGTSQKTSFNDMIG